MANVREFLHKTEPFKNLSAEDLTKLAGGARIHTHPKGEYIFSEGETAENVWLLEQGRLEIYKFSSDGRPRAIETINPGDIFGTLCRIGKPGAAYPCTAVAAIDSQSISFEDHFFWDLFKKSPSMVTGICTLCSERLNHIQDTSCLSQESVDKRIAHTLLDLSKKHGDTLPFTKREISEIAATTVETTIRIMSTFQKKGWISSARGKIKLETPSKLESLLR